MRLLADQWATLDALHASLLLDYVPAVTAHAVAFQSQHHLKVVLLPVVAAAVYGACRSHAAECLFWPHQVRDLHAVQFTM